MEDFDQTGAPPDAGEDDRASDEPGDLCTSNYDCPLDEYCDTETEHPDGPGGECVASEPGVHCAVPEDCAEGERCIHLSIIIGPRGFCVAEDG